MASEHGLLTSILRMHRALKAYLLKYPGAFVILDGDWQRWVEFEAVLDISSLLTTLAQYEQLYMAAFAPIIKKMVYDHLTAVSIKLIDVDHITADPRLPRVETRVEDLTETGSTCLERATIEFERRFLNSNLNTRLPVDDPRTIEINERQLVATLLDVRTVRCSHLAPEQRREAQAALKSRYVNFFCMRAKVMRAAMADSRQVLPDVRDSQEKSGPSGGSLERDPKKQKKGKEKEGITSGVVYDPAASLDSLDGFDFLPSDEEGDDTPVAKTEADFLREDTAAAEEEFPRVFKNWVRLVVDYSKEFPDHNLV